MARGISTSGFADQTMKKSQTPSVLATLALLATLTVQCGTPQATQVQVVEEKVLKIGVLGPFTGSSAATG